MANIPKKPKKPNHTDPSSMDYTPPPRDAPPVANDSYNSATQVQENPWDFWGEMAQAILSVGDVASKLSDSDTFKNPFDMDGAFAQQFLNTDKALGVDKKNEGITEINRVFVTKKFQEEATYPAFKIWKDTPAGKRFMQKYATGGSYGHISMTFDVSYKGYSEMILYIRSKKTGAKVKTRDLEYGAIQNKVALANGTDKDEELIVEFLISPDTIPQNFWEKDFKKAEICDSILHEIQHFEIDLDALEKNIEMPTPYQQHVLMKNTQGTLYKERYDNFLFMKYLWQHHYNQNKEEKTVEKYIESIINGFHS